jgi:putative DNA primase/helicase
MLFEKRPHPKQDALKYAAKGLRIVPMHTVQDGCCSCSNGENCDNPAKHPQTAHGVKDATTEGGRHE